MSQESTKEDKPALAEEEKSEPEEHHNDENHVLPKEKSGSRWARFKNWYAHHKKWTIPATVLVIILLLAAIPFTRYTIAGLFIKQDFSVKVLDSTTNTAVSGATVAAGSVSAQTDATGKATLHQVKVGSHNFLVTKKYYKDGSLGYVVPIVKQKNIPQVKLSATGRQVKIKVTNIITGKPLNGANIGVAGADYKTDIKGLAVVVVPAGVSAQKATISHDGYNNALEVTIKVSDDTIAENDLTLTPAGKIYFLSKLSGKIDVVKTNLDGTARQTVLAGTGKEEDTGTVLLASRDWKYLALLSRRAGDNASLYLIDTGNNDNLTNIDQGNAVFTPVGWSDNNFVYTVNRPSVSAWQPHAQALKSFNAQSKQLLTLDQSNASGTNSYDYAQEYYGQVYEIGKNIIYEKTWNSNYYNSTVLNDKTAGIYSISAAGGNAHTLKTFGYAYGQTTYLQSAPYEGSQIYYSVTEKDKQSFYAYDNGKVTAKTGIQDEFNKYNQSPTTYLLSPAGKQTFWSEPRDGKNTMFIGDQDGENGKQIASLSDYNTYGWYTDDYLLVSKNSSELYAMPVGGAGNTVKISDYHKPARTFNGYGGGYGGL